MKKGLSKSCKISLIVCKFHQFIGVHLLSSFVVSTVFFRLYDVSKKAEDLKYRPLPAPSDNADNADGMSGAS